MAAEKTGLIAKMLNLLQTRRRAPPPQLGDGKYDSEESGNTVKSAVIRELEGRKMSIPEQLDLYLELVAIANAGGEAVTITEMVEGLMGLFKMDGKKVFTRDGKKEEKLAKAIVDNAWATVRHPPVTSVGQECRYRTADGSNNNILYPHVGKAGTAFAKHVKSVHVHPAVMPNPGALFNALVVRTEFKPHPNKISSLLYYMTVLISHDLCHPSSKDPTINKNSSYLDLSPLYGSSPDEQNLVRTFTNGTLKPDTISETRLELYPPGVSALLICFNRFHNYVAAQLLEINEGDKFSADKDPAILDNDLFQTSRLVTCGMYLNIILNDYIPTLVGIPELNAARILDPTVFGDDVTNSTAVGNQVSCEFSLFYKFHSMISDSDDKYMQTLMKNILPGKDLSIVTSSEYEKGIADYLAKFDKDPSKRSVVGLSRGTTGRLDDAALIKILTASTEDCSAAFNSGIPAVLGALEKLGITQSRSMGLASLNEFRAAFGLPVHKSFDSITSDPVKAKTLMHFYSHPDNVEFYPGVLVEENKSKFLKAGWIPGPTISKAILCDTVSLLRGDRFYTQDYSPTTLTAWGYTFITSDPTVADGRVIYKLLMRAFPKWYPFNSIHAFFPFTIPSQTTAVLKSRELSAIYSLDPPKTPATNIHFIEDYDACEKILSDPGTYKIWWGPVIKGLTGGEYMLSGDTQYTTDQHKNLHKNVYCPGSTKAMWDFWTETMDVLIKAKAYQLGDYYEVDIVRDVSCPAFARFWAGMFNIPIKTDKTPHGLVTEQQLFEGLGVIFTYLFFNGDEATGLWLKTTAFGAYKKLAELLKLNINKIKLEGKFGEKIGHKEGDGFMQLYGDNLIRKMLKDGYSVDEVITQILLTAAGVANFGPIFGQILEVYFSPQYKDAWNDFKKIANGNDDQDSRDKLTRYIMEGCRLSTVAPELARVPNKDVVINDGGKQVPIKAGDTIFTGLRSANHSEEMFPEPNKIKIDRPLDKYIYYGRGPHTCWGGQLNNIAMTAMLRSIARLPNVKLAPGKEGQLKYTYRGPFRVYMNGDWSKYSPWPTSYKLHFDAVRGN